MHEIANFLYTNDEEGLKSLEFHLNSSLAYLPPKVAIAILRISPRVSNESPSLYSIIEK